MVDEDDGGWWMADEDDDIWFLRIMVMIAWHMSIRPFCK